MSDILTDPDITTLELLHRGKVRNNYAIDDSRMLMVATDRLSAYDVVLPDPIPGKGAVLTAISKFWFGQTTSITPNHLVEADLAAYLGDHPRFEQIARRAVIVQRLTPLPVEAIVRGYLIGSGWREYQESGSVSGISLPAGLQQAARLPDVLFTPSTKAAVGDHDENIDFATMSSLVGQDIAQQVRERSIALYQFAADLALKAGIIIADTKFEFGLDNQGQVILMDEILTPDSSRFWPADQYRVGISPPSFDKQYVRDYLDTLDWDQKAPGPALPADVISGTQERYAQAWHLLANGPGADRNG